MQSGSICGFHAKEKGGDEKSTKINQPHFTNFSSFHSLKMLESKRSSLYLERERELILSLRYFAVSRVMKR